MLIFAPRAAESRMNEEFDFHVEMETDRLVRQQHLPHDEAPRQALVAFGGETRHMETLREGRGLAWLGGLATIAFSGSLSLAQLGFLVAHSAVMFDVCLFACVVPTRRALGVEPMEALRAE
jgi:hypothetical protein